MPEFFVHVTFTVEADSEEHAADLAQDLETHDTAPLALFSVNKIEQ
jgi:hypothetical protein